MCWGSEVSAAFAGLYFIFILFYYYWKPKNYVPYIIFTAFYMIMELFQTFQWIYGDVVNSVTTNNTCSRVNRSYTYVAFALIWLQPLMFSVIGYYAYKTKTFFRLMILNIKLLIFMFGVTIYIQFFTTTSLGTIVTCTFIGVKHHLAWLFNATFVVDHYVVEQGNDYKLYFFMSLVSFINYESDLYAIPLSWLLCLVITFIIGTSSYEIASFWCMLSVFSTVIIFLYSLYYKYFREEKTPHDKINV